MRFLFIPLLLVAALGLSGCFGLYETEDWGYTGDSGAYQAGERHGNAEHDD